MPEGMLSPAMQEHVSQFIREHKPANDTLPIHAAFPYMVLEDMETDRFIMCFDLSCDKGTGRGRARDKGKRIPSEAMLEMKDSRSKKVFSSRVISIYYASLKHRYPGRNMFRTSSLTFTGKEFSEIWNNPDIEITISYKDKISTFSSIYV